MDWLSTQVAINLIADDWLILSLSSWSTLNQTILTDVVVVCKAHSKTQFNTSTHTLQDHTHTHTHTRTKCPAPLCLCKRRLPYVSQTAGDIFFCSLLFPLISFVGYCGRPVWVSLKCVCVCVCVCVCGRGRGAVQTGGGMSFLQSLHFGIRTGSGPNRGNVTSSPSLLLSSLPLSSYFFLYSPFFLPLSVPPSSSPVCALPIHRVISQIPAVTRVHGVCVCVCVCVFRP